MLSKFWQSFSSSVWGRKGGATCLASSFFGHRDRRLEDRMRDRIKRRKRTYSDGKFFFTYNSTRTQRANPTQTWQKSHWNPTWIRLEPPRPKPKPYANLTWTWPKLKLETVLTDPSLKWMFFEIEQKAFRTCHCKPQFSRVVTQWTNLFQIVQ